MVWKKRFHIRGITIELRGGNSMVVIIVGAIVLNHKYEISISG